MPFGKSPRQTRFQAPPEHDGAVRFGVAEQMTQNGVGETRIRVELYNLADSLGLQVIEIPSGDLLPLCFDEYLLQTPIPSHLSGPL